MIEGSDPITFLSVPFSRLYKGEGTRVGLGQGMIWESFRVQSFKVAREWINDSLTWKTVLVDCRLGSGEERPPSDIVMPLPSANSALPSCISCRFVQEKR